ncbi:hypothetical protein RN001_002279 [Aquatica leii]|uniref:Uncharacterized protein n=1 Tax=Aquatica leii TaxID=1421715 RepID=A0AAN7QNE5_9COLE|nr:hypothetical protein RN001_002279 [Aquatica leii]
MDITLRKVMRGQLTKLINNVSEIVISESVDIEEVHVLIARLKETYKNLSAISLNALSTMDSSKWKEECEKNMEYEDRAIAAIARLERFAAKQDPNNQPSSPAGPIDQSISVCRNTATNKMTKEAIVVPI